MTLTIDKATPALRPLVAPGVGVFTAGTVGLLVQPSAAPLSFMRVWIRNLSATATVGFSLLPDLVDGSTLTLTTTFVIPPGQVEKFSCEGGLNLWLVASADATNVSLLVDSV